MRKSVVAKVLGLGVVASAMLAVVGAGFTPVARADERVLRCGGEGNDVQAAFEISAAARLWEYLPAMGKAPHLARDGEPAFIVVFRGDYTLPFPLAVPNQDASEPAVYQNVVCVLQANGDINLYADVSRIGYNAP